MAATCRPTTPASQGKRPQGYAFLEYRIRSLLIESRWPGNGAHAEASVRGSLDDDQGTQPHSGTEAGSRSEDDARNGIPAARGGTVA